MSKVSPKRVSPKRVVDEALDALGATEDDLESLVEAMSMPAPPPAPDELRSRLLLSLARAHRFDDLEGQVASLLDIDLAQAQRFLLAVDGAEGWSRGPSEGVELFHVEGGPSVRDAVTGFVRLAGGTSFPEHEHLGDEVVLVLQGGLEDSLGHQVLAGEAAAMPAGSVHSFHVLGTRPLLYLAVIQRGVRIGDASILPGDPRG